MATLVAIAGGLIGSIFGVPQLGFLAGSILGSLIFSGSSKGGPKLKDLHVTGSTYGSAIPWLWGTCRMGGNIIWTYLLKQHAHHAGGKGGPATYTYSWTGAVALCDTTHTGPIQKILKIWADTKLVYDATGQSGITKNIPGNGGGGKGGGGHSAGAPVVNGGVANAYNKLGRFRVYTGTETQMPDPAYETLVGADNATANRGLAYIVFDDVNLDNYGNRVPNWTFEVAGNNDSEPLSQNAFKFNFDASVVSAPDGDAVAVDTFRHRAYFFSTGAAAGIHAMDLKTGNSVMTSLASRTFSSSVSTAFITEGPIVADDGYLWVWSGTANYAPWIKIDPDSLLEVAHIGTSNPFTSIDGSTTFAHYPVPLVLGKANCLFVAGEVFRDLHVLDLDSLSEVSSGSFTENSMKVCGGNQTGDNTADVWGLGVPNVSGGSPDPLNLYHIPTDFGATVITPVLVIAINPSDVDSDWTNWNDVSTFMFDSTDGNVVFFVKSNDTVSAGHHHQYLVKVNTTTGSIMWRTAFENTTGSSENLPGNPDYGSYQSIISSGVYSVIDGHHNVWTFSTQDGTAVKNLWTGNLSAGFQAWADPFGAILFHGDDNQILPTPLSNNWGIIVTNDARGGRLLGDVVSEVCRAVGFLDADLDVTALTDTVEGYILDSQMLAKDALLPLSLAFLFDGVESDYMLKFVKRGGSSIATIPSSDLAYLDKKMNMIVNETRLQEVDLPNNISLNFLDPNHNYQQATQYSRRPAAPYPTMYSKASHTENLPLVAEPGFMKQLAEKLLFTSWIERVSYKTTLPWTYLKYDPTDVLTLTLTDDTTIVTRMATVNIGADFSMQWESLSQSAPTYVSSATTVGGDGFIQQTLAPSTATRLFLLDMPLLRDTDDSGQSFAILYDAAAGYATPWAGAAIAKSNDDINFVDEPPIFTSNAVIWGSAVNALGDTDHPFAIDYTNTLTVNMNSGGGASLSSASLLDVCNGANVAALLNTNNKTVEIIQWMTSTANVDGSYTLSGLLRGRRGTEVFTGSHATGDLFVLCATNTMSAIKMALSDLNVQRFFRPTTVGTLTEDAPIIGFIDTGRTLQPYQPVQQSATLVGSDIQLSWVRRTRLGGELRDLTGDVPLSEQSEAYEVDIYNALGDTILRSVRVDYPTSPEASPGYLYLAADIATDFGSTPTTLNVNVRQISTVIGAGLGKLQTLTVM